MPVSPARRTLTHSLLAALNEILNDPGDAGKKIIFDNMLEAIFVAERAEADARTDAAIVADTAALRTAITAEIGAAITAERALNAAALTAALNTYDVKRRRGVVLRMGVYMSAIAIVPSVLLAAYHFTVGPGAIAARTAAIETETASLKSRIGDAEYALSDVVDARLDQTEAQVAEQKAWIKAIWPDHDGDSDNVVDRVDKCRGTERGEDVLTGSVDGCSVNQAAWLCSDLPAVPAADMTFPWDMTNCPSGMLRPGERVTCTFSVKPDRSGLATNDNCQIH